MLRDTRPSGSETEAQLRAWDQAVLEDHILPEGYRYRVYLARAESVRDPRTVLQGTIITWDFDDPTVILPFLPFQPLHSLQREFTHGSRNLYGLYPETEPWTVDTFSRSRIRDIQGAINQQAFGLDAETDTSEFLREHFGLDYGKDQKGLDIGYSSAWSKGTVSKSADISGTFGLPKVRGYDAATVIAFSEKARNSFPGMRIKPMPVSAWLPQVTDLLTGSTKS